MLDKKRRGPMGRSTSQSRPPHAVLVIAAMLVLCGMLLLFSGALALADDGDASTGVDRWRFGVAPQIVLPSVVGDPATADMAVGEQITLDILVQDVVDLAGFQILMSYDPSVVHLGDGDLGRPGENAALGDFLVSPFVARNTISNTVGTIDVAVTQVGTDPRSGDGTLFSLIVQAVAPGDAAFVFDSVVLVDGGGVQITATSTDPVITVLSGSATPTASSTPTATDTFTPTYTATSSATATETATPTITLTPDPSSTATLTPTDTSTATVTATETNTPTATDTATSAPTATDTATPESSYTPASTPTATATASPSPTATSTATPEGPFYYLDPQAAIVGPDETFDVMIYADSGGQEISGVEVHLEWDPSLLEATQIVPGDTFQGYNTYSPLSDVDNGAGTLWYAHGMIEDFCVEGHWLVATVTFRTLNYGTTAIAFGSETMMACAGLSLQPLWINGEVQIGYDPTPTLTHTPTLTDTPTTATPVPVLCTDPLVNGGFELGATGWDWVSWAEASARTPHSGANSAYLAGYDESDDAIHQSFAIPSDAITATLSYWWYVETIESEHPYDYMYVELLHSGGTTTLAAYSDGDVLNTWHEAGPFDLIAYAGETVQLRFRSETDGKAYTSFFVDDVTLEICAPEQETPTPDPSALKVYIPLVLKDYSTDTPQ